MGPQEYGGRCAQEVGTIMPKILIADDHAIMRQGLRCLIESQTGMTVVGEAEDGQTAVRLAAELFPDVIVMDVTMPILNGIEAARQIVQHNPNAKVVILSMHGSEQVARDALRAGASAYVLKHHGFDELLRALEAIARNSHYLSPEITDILVQDYVHGSTPRAPSAHDNLGGAERQILQLLAEGQTVKQIAKRLHLSPKTVDGRRRRIMSKLGVSSSAGLIKYAIRAGLTSVDF